MGASSYGGQILVPVATWIRGHRTTAAGPARHRTLSPGASHRPRRRRTRASGLARAPAGTRTGPPGLSRAVKPGVLYCSGGLPGRRCSYSDGGAPPAPGRGTGRARRARAFWRVQAPVARRSPAARLPRNSGRAAWRTSYTGSTARRRGPTARCSPSLWADVSRCTPTPTPGLREQAPGQTDPHLAVRRTTSASRSLADHREVGPAARENSVVTRVTPGRYPQGER